MFIASVFPGCGKTTFVKDFPDVADSDSSHFPKDNFPQNYIKHIRERYLDRKMTLVSSHKVVREALVEARLPFLLIYPARECKEEYVQRYLNRDGFNGGEKFAKLIADNWEVWITECENQTHCKKIILLPGQFLSTVLEVKQRD